MKRICIIPMLCLFFAILCSCGNKEISSEADFSKKRVGEEKYGFIDVPEDWDLYEDENLENNNVIQFTDPDGYSVITMQYFSDSDAVTSTMNLGMMLENSVEDLTSEVVEFGGVKAYQLAGYAIESERIMICWIFDGDDGYTHAVSIESNENSIFELCDTYLLSE